MATPTAVERASISCVHVTIPAHNEQERIAACLASVLRATTALTNHRPHVVATVTVVLDRCQDGTGQAVSASGATALPGHFGSVGAARRAGVAHIARQTRPELWAATLIVNTDADCVVPPSWLLDHVELAAKCDVVLGRVEPCPSEMSATALAAWWERHPLGRGGLHGANLGVRLDAYLRAGGFPARADKEDVALVRALRDTGAEVVGGTSVTTSARRQGRVVHGFSEYLRWLDEQVEGDTRCRPSPLTAVRR